MGIQINGNTNNINAGIGSLSIEDLNELDIVGVATASNFKTGSSNLHSTGLTVGNALVHSTGINVGTGATVHCPSTNTLTFGTNSAERLRIKSNGDVAINGTATTDAKLDVRTDSDPTTGVVVLAKNNTANGNGTFYMCDINSVGNWSFGMPDNTNAFAIVKGIGNSGTEYLRVTSDGNIGIGTATPVTNRGPLHVHRVSSNDVHVHLTNTDTGTTQNDGMSLFANSQHGGLWLRENSPMLFATSDTERLRIASDGNMGLGTNSLVGNAANVYLTVNGSTLGGIALKANGTTQGYLQGTGSAIRLSSDGSKPITFDTNGSERLRIASDGDMGVGTNSPTARLHVSGGDGMLVERSSGTSIAGFKHSGASLMNIYFQNSGSTNHPSIGSSNQDLILGTNNYERSRITSGGNFSLGNTHAAKKVHISTTGNQKILIDPNYNNNSGGSSNSEANANNVVDSILIRTSFGDNAASQTNAGHKWGIKFQGYNGNDFTQNAAKIAAVYAVSEDAAGGYNRNVGLTFHTSPYNTAHREAMRINTNGAVTKPYHPAFAARLGSNVDITQNTSTDLVFSVQEFDNSSSYNTSNGRFTAPVAGKYYFGVQIYAGFDGAGVRVMHAHFRVNGTSVAQTDMFGGASNHGGSMYHPTAVGHMFRELNANDYVTFNLGGFSHTGGQAILYASTGNRFFGHLVT